MAKKPTQIFVVACIASLVAISSTVIISRCAKASRDIRISMTNKSPFVTIDDPHVFVDFDAGVEKSSTVESPFGGSTRTTEKYAKVNWSCSITHKHLGDAAVTVEVFFRNKNGGVIETTLYDTRNSSSSGFTADNRGAITMESGHLGEDRKRFIGGSLIMSKSSARDLASATFQSDWQLTANEQVFYDWANKLHANWSMLREGMHAHDVESLLGRPFNISTSNEYFLWTYECFPSESMKQDFVSAGNMDKYRHHHYGVVYFVDDKLMFFESPTAIGLVKGSRPRERPGNKPK